MKDFGSAWILLETGNTWKTFGLIITLRGKYGRESKFARPVILARPTCPRYRVYWFQRFLGLPDGQITKGKMSTVESVSKNIFILYKKITIKLLNNYKIKLKILYKTLRMFKIIIKT
jgi:hypothetical protein